MNADGITGSNRKAALTEGHPALALGDVIDLFRHAMLMQKGFAARWNPRFSQALVAVPMDPWVHEFADLRSVLGDIGFKAGVALVHRGSGGFR